MPDPGKICTSLKPGPTPPAPPTPIAKWDTDCKDWKAIGYTDPDGKKVNGCEQLLNQQQNCEDWYTEYDGYHFQCNVIHDSLGWNKCAIKGSPDVKIPNDACGPPRAWQPTPPIPPTPQPGKPPDGTSSCLRILGEDCTNEEERIAVS